MNIKTDKAPFGSLKISKDVIGAIVYLATCEIEGVAGVAGLGENIKGMLSQRRIVKPVNVVLKEETAIIDIQVILEYGSKIPQISRKIQEAVKEAVQSMTGIAVSKVNITVAGVAPIKNA